MNAGALLKTRLRDDLRSALKEKRSGEVKVIRTLIAALDHAEAPPIRSVPAASEPQAFLGGAAEIARLTLGEGDVRRILQGELEERERAADALDAQGLAERALELRAEAGLVRLYLE